MIFCLFHILRSSYLFFLSNDFISFSWITSLTSYQIEITRSCLSPSVIKPRLKLRRTASTFSWASSSNSSFSGRTIISETPTVKPRSEERRVGKECRSWWLRCHKKKKNKQRHAPATAEAVQAHQVDR